MSALTDRLVLAGRQCPKRLWLEVHRPDLREESTDATRLADRRDVRAAARQLLDPQGLAQRPGPPDDEQAASETMRLLRDGVPVLDAVIEADGMRVTVDALLPEGGQWRIVAISSSTRVQQHHLEALALRTYLVAQTGLPLGNCVILHPDSGRTWEGGARDGLFAERNVTAEAMALVFKAPGWIETAQRRMAGTEPLTETGPHCNAPSPCPFLGHCRSLRPRPARPVDWLPGPLPLKARQMIEQDGIEDLADVPEGLLTQLQRRVRHCSLTGTVYHDRKGARAALLPHGGSALFLDFEGVAFAMPRWPGTRPYQAIPFQFSLHRFIPEHPAGRNLTVSRFIDLSGEDPSQAFADALLHACGESGTIFVYNAAYERTRITELAERFPLLAPRLEALAERIVDLLPITRAHYYHPDQQGSWSLKAILPTIVPNLAHDGLDGVRDGMMAVEAYREAIDPATTPERRREIENQLLAYCALDTLALFHLWRHLCGEPQAGAELPDTDTVARTGTGADGSSDRITGGRQVILDPLRFEPYEIAATLFTLLAFPDKPKKHRDEVHAALCRQAIETSASGVEGIAPVTPKPVYFDLDIEAAARIVEQTGRRLGQRLEAAYVGIGLLHGQLDLPLPRGVRRRSVNEMIRKHLAFREDGGDEGNFKNRVLGPSYPVLHLAIAFAIELERLERQGLKRPSLDRLLLMPRSIDAILREAQEFEPRILAIPRVRIDPDRLIRLRVLIP